MLATTKPGLIPRTIDDLFALPAFTRADLESDEPMSGEAIESRIADEAQEFRSESGRELTPQEIDCKRRFLANELLQLREQHKDRPPEKNGKRDKVEVTPDRHIVVAEVIKSLAGDKGLYQRGGRLIHVIDAPERKRMLLTLAAGPRIEIITAASFAARVTSTVYFFAESTDKEGGTVESQVHPPRWLPGAVCDAGHWPSVRELEAIVTCPVLRHDGTVLQSPGYDGATGILYHPTCEFGKVPDAPTHEEIRSALAAVLEVVVDFPFEQPHHKAAWLAGLLTLLARFSFDGPTPLFLADANVRAAGKGLLLDCIAYIVFGGPFSRFTYTRDPDELAKSILALALEGDRAVLFDNVSGRLGDRVLDAALTATSWKGRRLGKNENPTLPLSCCWFATGNNIEVMGDTSRRVCPIRLCSPLERPEDREGFRHADLLAFVSQNRPRLLVAALTLLRGYFAAGRPQVKLPPWGSYGGWSDAVRQCVVWLRMDDPAAGKAELAESDSDAESLASLIAAWDEMVPGGLEMSTADIVRALDDRENRDNFHAMRDIVNAMGKDDKSRAKALGYRLRAFRRRIVNGRYFDWRKSGTRIWRTHSADDFWVDRVDRADIPAYRRHLKTIPEQVISVNGKSANSNNDNSRHKKGCNNMGETSTLSHLSTQCNGGDHAMKVRANGEGRAMVCTLCGLVEQIT